MIDETRERKVPSFFGQRMITAEQVRGLIQDKLEEKECFVVELVVKEGNSIHLEVDGKAGFSIKDCVDFNKAIEHKLDREVEDYELHVSSPGLNKPLRVIEQYYKNIGRELKVVTNDKTFEGLLKEVDEQGIVLEYAYKEKVEGKKKKLTIVKQEKLLFDTIKETTIIISFK
jgi:ribosome maturation factor RimP